MSDGLGINLNETNPPAPVGAVNVVFQVDPATKDVTAYYYPGAGGSAVWGSITGTLASQADLQALLNTKANSTIALIYDIPVYLPGAYTSNQMIAKIRSVRNWALPQNLLGTAVGLDTNPTGPMIFSLQKNGIQFGTITVGSDGTITLVATATTFAAYDIFTVIAPISVDSTGAGLAVTFAGTRS